MRLFSLPCFPFLIFIFLAWVWNAVYRGDKVWGHNKSHPKPLRLSTPDYTLTHLPWIISQFKSCNSARRQNKSLTEMCRCAAMPYTDHSNVSVPYFLQNNYQKPHLRHSQYSWPLLFSLFLINPSNSSVQEFSSLWRLNNYATAPVYTNISINWRFYFNPTVLILLCIICSSTLKT